MPITNHAARAAGGTMQRGTPIPYGIGARAGFRRVRRQPPAGARRCPTASRSMLLYHRHMD